MEFERNGVNDKTSLVKLLKYQVNNSNLYVIMQLTKNYRKLIPLLNRVLIKKI